MKNLLFPILSLLIPLLLTSCSKPAATPDTAADGVQARSAPGWTLRNLEGREVSLTDFRGKVVVLDFWATWCPPCRAEMPDYVKLQTKYGDQGLVIVGLSLDAQGPAEVKKFTESLGINYRIVMADQDVTEAYKVEVMPTTFLVDRQGRIRHEKTGPIKDLAEYEKLIVALL